MIYLVRCSIAVLAMRCSIVMLVASAGLFAGASWAAELKETPYLAGAVAAGDLPPVGERLPASPWIVDLSAEGLSVGQPGGRLNILMAKAKDTRQLVVYGYARLICYDTEYSFVADILEGFEVEEGRIFTFRLREGHRWSDGEPFTAEDFRYYWEDVANDETISPLGPSGTFAVDGEVATFEVIDEQTVRYSWSQPNPYFLPAIAGATPLYIYRPSHYLKGFHAKYADEAALAAAVEESGQRDWAALHHTKDRQYKNNNPDLPTLQPWSLVTRPPADRFIFTRNPYYHRIDADGQQLPYIDEVVMGLAASKLIPAKAGTGESDLQARYIAFDDYTFLKESEGRHPFTVNLWRTAKGAHIALYPNLSITDPVWRALLRDVRLRRALSLAINRKEINDVIYFGLAIEGNNTVLPQSPLFREHYQSDWTDFDIDQANHLLDEIGLTERNSSGIRLLPDGRPFEIIVETAGESTEETDVLALISDSWREIGVGLFSKPSQREVFRNRIFAGDTIMSIWSGIENGLPTADLSPNELAPTSQIQLQWPKWGQYRETAGQSGEPIDVPEAAELLELADAWRRAPTKEERAGIWHKMLDIHADQVFTIGVIRGTLQPVIVDASLRNVPKEGIYNWDPGAHFGIYKPDTFWFADPARRAAAK